MPCAEEDSHLADFRLEFRTGCGNKAFNAEFNQRRAAVAMNAAIAWLSGDKDAEARVQTFLRARANTVEGGTSEVLRTSVAERVLGLPREPEVDRNVAWKDVKRS